MPATSDTIIAAIRKRHPEIRDEDRVGVWSNPKDMGEAVQADGKPAIKGIATTDDVDAEEEVVLPSGARTDYILKNRKYFADHMYGVSTCIGRIRTLNPFPTARADKQRGWMFVAPLFFGLTSGLAEDVYKIAQECPEGIGNSVAFKAVDYGRPTAEEQKQYPKAGSIVRTWDWVELSATPMPCNVPCQGGAVTIHDYDRRLSLLDGLLTKSMIQRSSAEYFAPEVFGPKPVTVVFLN